MCKGETVLANLLSLVSGRRVQRLRYQRAVLMEAIEQERRVVHGWGEILEPGAAVNIDAGMVKNVLETLCVNSGQQLTKFSSNFSSCKPWGLRGREYFDMNLGVITDK